jgi:hypothetical protein
MKKDELLFIGIYTLVIGSIFIKCFGLNIGLLFTGFIVIATELMMFIYNLIRRKVWHK